MWRAFCSNGVLELIGTEEHRLTSSSKIGDGNVVDAMKGAKTYKDRGVILRAVDLKKRPLLVAALDDTMRCDNYFIAAVLLVKLQKCPDLNIKTVLNYAALLQNIEKVLRCKGHGMILARAAQKYGYENLDTFRELLGLDWLITRRDAAFV